MRGYTLVELLVALCVGLLALTGAITGLLHIQAVWNERAIQARLMERAQYAFASLGPELQMAGFIGTGEVPDFIDATLLPVGARRCGPALEVLTRRPVELLAPPWPLACAAQGGGVVVGTPVLVVRRASVDAGDPASGRIQLLGGPGQPTHVQWDAATAIPASPGATLRDLQVRAFYIARSADGDAATPALRVKNLSAIAGAPAFIDTEVMPGVANLQATLLPDATAPRRVRLTLTLQADADEMRAARTRIAVTREFTLRNTPVDLSAPE